MPSENKPSYITKIEEDEEILLKLSPEFRTKVIQEYIKICTRPDKTDEETILASALAYIMYMNILQDAPFMDIVEEVNKAALVMVGEHAWLEGYALP